MFVGQLADDTNYLKIINDNQAREINQLHETIRNYREVNGALLERLGITSKIKSQMDLRELEPIGGRKPLRARIAEAEAAAAEKYFKGLEEDATK